MSCYSWNGCVSCCQWNTWYLRSGQLTAAVEDYLLWHWFGPVCRSCGLNVANLLHVAVEQTWDKLLCITLVAFNIVPLCSCCQLTWNCKVSIASVNTEERSFFIHIWLSHLEWLLLRYSSGPKFTNIVLRFIVRYVLRLS